MPDPRVIFRILAENKQAKKVLSDTQSAFDKTSGAIGKLALPAAAVLGGIAAGALSTIDAASDVEQAYGGLESVFKSTADEAKKMAESASNDVGLAAADYAKLATILGAQLKGMGVASDELQPKSDELIRLGADLAATFGGTTADAVEAISSLLRGERDPIEKYGVSLKQTDIDARLAADGVTTAAKATAKYAQATKGAESANKAVERTHLAVQKAALSLQAAQKSGDPIRVKSAKLTLNQAKAAAKAADAAKLQADAAVTAQGKVSGLDSDAMKAATAQASLALLTEQTADAQGGFARETDTAAHAQQVANAAFTDAKAALGTALLPVVVLVADAFADMAGWIKENTTVVQIIVGVIAALAAAILAINVAMSVYKAIQIAITAQQWLMNAAFLANPVTIIVLAILALVAALILAYQNSEEFRAIVDKVFAAVSDIIGKAVAFISGVIGTLVDIFEEPFTALLDVVKSVFGLAQAVIGLFFRVVSGIFTKLVEFVTTTFKPLTDILAGPFEKAKKIIGDVFKSLERIVRDVVGNITGFLKSITDKIDAVAGMINDVNPFAASAGGGAAPQLATVGVPVPGLRAARAAPDTGPVTVNVYTTGDSMQAEQAVLRALRRQTRLNAGVVPAFGWSGVGLGSRGAPRLDVRPSPRPADDA